MRHQTLLERLNNAETLSGLSIYIKATHPENEIRSRASLLSHWVCTEIEIEGVADDVLIDALSILRREYTDPRHYGDNKPGSFFVDHTPTTPDPAFNYWDFWSFAMSGYPLGFVGLSQDIGLDQRITYRIFCGLIALLLIDDSIRCLGIGDVFRAAAGIFDGLEAFDEMLLSRRYEQIAQETRSAQARRGGHAKNRETDGYKRLVIEEWKSGRFRGNKTEAARWAVKNFPLKSQEAVRRWVRKYEADSGDTTKLA
jgi:hypothetical protein